MSNEITYSAESYVATKTSPFRNEVERYTIFTLIGDPTGLRVLDAGTGDGRYARELVVRGAEYVLGVDSSADFIKLATDKNDGYEGRIEYQRAPIQESFGLYDMDLVLGAYILSYPQTYEELVQYCKAIASHMKDGARFVGFNNNPFDTYRGSRFDAYEFSKSQASDVDGAEVVYLVKGMEDEPIVNYYHSPKAYEEAFQEAGFREFQWQEVMLDPAEKDNPYWQEFFADTPPFIAMVAIK